MESKMKYLAHTLNVRTVRKRYENFVVNAIYSKIDNPELVPVTQKCVRIPNSNNHYLLDLYFPQLNYAIEVDESHHFTPEQMEADRLRTEFVKKTLGCNVSRILIYKIINENEIVRRTYEDVNKQIDREVEKIKKMIAEKEANGAPLLWSDSYTVKNELPSKENVVKSTKEKTNTDIPKSSNKNSIAKMLNRPIDPMHQPGDISFENIAVSNWEVKDWLNFIKKLETRVRYTVSGRHNTHFWFIMSVIKGFGGNPHTDIGLEINTKQLVVKLYVNDDIQDPDKQKDFRKQQRDSIERYLIGIMNEFQEYDIKYNKRTGKSVIIFEILDFPITRDGQKIDMEKTIELIETVQSKFETVVPKWSNKLIADRNKG